jgi:transcriptional regulator with XRE-family HTH domain
MKPAEIMTIRRDLGMTQEAFAKNLGVSFATVNRWENGKCSPQADRILRLIEARKYHDPRTAHPTGLDHLVPYWVKRLTDAIARDDFQGTVNALLVATMSEAYDRGFAEGKKRK